MSDVVESDPFQPDWTISPGATIGAILSARSLSRDKFATAIGESVEVVQRLLLGLESVDDDLAERLSKALGSSRAFWIAREEQFRGDSFRLRQRRASNDQETWVKQFPVREMIALGWIREVRSPSEAARECLRLFGVPDVAAWQSRYAETYSAAAFRMSSSVKSSSGAVTAWLRWAELIAERTPCIAWNPTAFGDLLQTAKRLSWQKDPATFLPILRKLCSEVGVAVVVARTPKGCPASGATRFLTSEKAMMVLSFRYRSDDQFWFTFFHEAGHLLLHGPGPIFIEGGTDIGAEEEVQANKFAQTTLIPTEYKEIFDRLHTDGDSILRFARRVGVSPGLIVGQLQHMKRVPADRLNWLKRRYDWGQIEADRLIP